MAEVSITDIARAAGVSPSTVSRALPNHPRISPERCAAIQALAREMGYRPSQVARSLVTGKTRTLGVVATDVTDPFVAEVMKGAEAAGARGRLRLALCHVEPGPRSRRLLPAQMLLDRQVDAMIVISSRAGGRYAELLAQNRRVPLVLVNQAAARRGQLQRAHEQRGRRTRRRGLSARARPPPHRFHRRAGRRPQQPRAPGGLPPGLSTAGRPGILRPNWSLPGSGRPEDGPRALEAFLRLADPPYGGALLQRPGGHRAAGCPARAGLPCPADLSVVGYDNIPLSGYTLPPLTTVDQPKQALGRQRRGACACDAGGPAGRRRSAGRGAGDQGKRGPEEWAAIVLNKSVTI